MGRAIGANAKVAGAFEAVTGTTPAASFFTIPLVSHSLGETRDLLTSDLVGLGREPQDPIDDVAKNVGDVVVPMDVRNIAHWLKMAFGPSVDTAGQNGEEIHTFASGAPALPSMSIEVGAPEVPAYSVHFGAKLNDFKVSMARSGLLNATCSLIAIGESPIVGASVAGVPTSLPVLRFAQATGSIMKDGVALASVVGADFTFSNALETVESIQPSGRIEDSDPGMVSMTGSLKVLFKDTVLLSAAGSGAPMALSFGWVNGPHSLIFNVPRVYLPPAKRPITGPKGIQAEFNWQASGSQGASVTVVLTNDVAAY